MPVHDLQDIPASLPDSAAFRVALSGALQRAAAGDGGALALVEVQAGPGAGQGPGQGAGQGAGQVAGQGAGPGQEAGQEAGQGAEASDTTALAAALGRRLASELRARDLVADLGDGRLGVLLAGLRSADEGARVIARLRRLLAPGQGASPTTGSSCRHGTAALASSRQPAPASARRSAPGPLQHPGPRPARGAAAGPAPAPAIRFGLVLLPAEGAAVAAVLADAGAALAAAPASPLAATLPAVPDPAEARDPHPVARTPGHPAPRGGPDPGPTSAPTPLRRPAPDRGAAREVALLQAALQQAEADAAGTADGKAGGTAQAAGADAGGAFHLAYQPIVDLATDRPVMWEALLRWQPGGRAVPTSRLIALAEAHGLIGALRDLTLGLVAAQLGRWRAEGRPRVVALNLSPSQCATEADLDRLLGWLEDPARRAAVVFEITETAPLDQAAHVGRIRRLAAAGVRLALDDFGTGFSRLEHLAQLPVDFLKLPEGFLRRSADPAYARLLQTLIGMGHAQGLTVIAEGVERPEELALLRRLGCDLAQGHLLGRPAPAALQGARDGP